MTTVLDLHSWIGYWMITEVVLVLTEIFSNLNQLISVHIIHIYEQFNTSGHRGYRHVVIGHKKSYQYKRQIGIHGWVHSFWRNIFDFK